jgi:hypothetical protein
MREYTVRVTQEEGKHVAWIDIDGSPVIKQLSRPGSQEGEFFESSADANSWADSHVLEIQASEQAQLEEVARQEALVAQAQADSERLLRIEEKLDQLLNP